VFFAVLTILGQFFIVAICINAFQDNFSELQEEEDKKTKLIDRTGMVAAFILLDLDESGSLTAEEFATLMKRVRPDLGDRQLAAVFKKVDANFDGILSIHEFVDGVERIVSLLAREKKAISPTPFRRQLLDQIVEQKWFRKLTLWFIMIDIWIFSLYGYGDDTLLTVLGAIVLGIFCLEIGLRVYAHGPKVYWDYNMYHKGGIEVQFAHRVDLGIIIISLLGFISMLPLHVVVVRPPFRYLFMCFRCCVVQYLHHWT
jgi:hypothetical protein